MASPYKHRPTVSHLMHAATLRGHKGNMLVSSPATPATPPLEIHPRAQSISEGSDTQSVATNDSAPRSGSLDIVTEKVMVKADHAYQKRRLSKSISSSSAKGRVAGAIWASMKKFGAKRPPPDAESIADSTRSSSFASSVPHAVKRATTYAGPIPVIMVSSEEHWNSFDDEVVEVAEVIAAQKTQRNLAKWRATDL